MKLWSAGYSWRDVLRRPAAPESAEAQLAAAGSRPLDLPPATAQEFGRQATEVQQARNDRKAILQIMEQVPKSERKLHLLHDLQDGLAVVPGLEQVPKSERKLLPDVIATVDGLLNRAENLARTSHAMSGDVDPRALARLEDKIEVIKREPESPERERQLNLLQRQRQALTDLVTRRQLVEDQIESCVLAMQNVRFDLLRLRSAGVAAGLDDLTHATPAGRLPRPLQRNPRAPARHLIRGGGGRRGGRWGGEGRSRLGRGLRPPFLAGGTRRESGADFRRVRTRGQRPGEKRAGAGGVAAPQGQKPAQDPRYPVPPPSHEARGGGVGEGGVAEGEQDRRGGGRPRRLAPGPQAPAARGGGSRKKSRGWPPRGFPRRTPPRPPGGPPSRSSHVGSSRSGWAEQSTITPPGELNQISTWGNTAARLRTMPATTGVGSWYSCTHWEKTPPSVRRSRTIRKNSGV